MLRQLALTGGLALALASCGGESRVEAEEPAPSAADLSGVKDYLLDHTGRLAGSTGEFAADAKRYYELAEAADFDLQRLWAENADEAAPLAQRLKRTWIKANPEYEQMEGVVAGTPSLADFDVAIDAGSSAAEDPESAVPFDLTLADGTVLEQPGNLFNLTEGALWGTLPDELGHPSAPADLDGDGEVAFGEVLPDAHLLLAAAESFERYASDLDDAATAWEPTSSDAFTALVVMVPTMSEYFGQWKESRFVAGDAATSESFNVVSRLSDIRDILGGLEVVYDSVEPIVAEADPAQAEQIETELTELSSFVGDLYEREQSGDRFTPEEADTLGTEAQERATAVAGQVSQAAAELEIPIQQ